MATVSRNNRSSGRAVLLLKNYYEGWNTTELCSSWAEGARWARRSWRAWLLKVHGFKEILKLLDTFEKLSDAEFLELIGGEVYYDYSAEEGRLYIFVQREKESGISYMLTLAPGSQFKL